MHHLFSRNALRLKNARLFSSNAKKSFNEIVESRVATASFKPNVQVPIETLKSILILTQRAPTGFNSQPYAGILVTTPEDRALVADAMLGGNRRKVQEASFAMIFAADLEPSRRIERLKKMESDAGTSADKIATMPLGLRMFANEGGSLTSAFKCVLGTVASPVVPIPHYVPTIAWSYKQTMVAATTFLYACQDHGIDTCPMEGFDSSRLNVALDLPDRYSVPIVIAGGYSASNEKKTSPRLDFDEVFFNGRFGNKLN